MKKKEEELFPFFGEVVKSRQEYFKTSQGTQIRLYIKGEA